MEQEGRDLTTKMTVQRGGKEVDLSPKRCTTLVHAVTHQPMANVQLSNLTVWGE